jgi:hypothetical protein
VKNNANFYFMFYVIVKYLVAQVFALKSERVVRAYRGQACVASGMYNKEVAKELAEKERRNGLDRGRGNS